MVFHLALNSAGITPHMAPAASEHEQQQRPVRPGDLAVGVFAAQVEVDRHRRKHAHQRLAFGAGVPEAHAESGGERQGNAQEHRHVLKELPALGQGGERALYETVIEFSQAGGVEPELFDKQQRHQAAYCHAQYKRRQADERLAPQGQHVPPA